jgi:hypothetical protein
LFNFLLNLLRNVGLAALIKAEHHSIRFQRPSNISGGFLRKTVLLINLDEISIIFFCYSSELEIRDTSLSVIRDNLISSRRPFTNLKNKRLK